MKLQSKYQTKCKLKKGDKVIVLSGRSKGETGTIDKVDRKTEKVFLSGVNIYKRHTRPSSQDDLGGIVDKVMPLPISNVALLDPKRTKQPGFPTKLRGNLKRGSRHFLRRPFRVRIPSEGVLPP